MTVITSRSCIKSERSKLIFIFAQEREVITVTILITVCGHNLRILTAHRIPLGCHSRLRGDDSFNDRLIHCAQSQYLQVPSGLWPNINFFNR